MANSSCGLAFTCAIDVEKILKERSRLAELPVDEASKYDFIINLKTAKALGLTIPPLLLLRQIRSSADEPRGQSGESPILGNLGNEAALVGSSFQAAVLPEKSHHLVNLARGRCR